MMRYLLSTLFLLASASVDALAQEPTSEVQMQAGVGFLGMIIIGIVAGWTAEKVTASDHGLLTNLLVGIAGSFLGGWLAQLIQHPIQRLGRHFARSGGRRRSCVGALADHNRRPFSLRSRARRPRASSFTAFLSGTRCHRTRQPNIRIDMTLRRSTRRDGDLEVAWCRHRLANSE